MPNEHAVLFEKANFTFQSPVYNFLTIIWYEKATENNLTGDFGHTFEMSVALDHFIQLSVWYQLVFGFCAATVHAYIVFSYLFDVNEERVPLQNLICGLSFFHLFCCLSGAMSCLFMKISHSVHKNLVLGCLLFWRSLDIFSVNIAVVLLAQYRLYSLIDPEKGGRTFTKSRIVLLVLALIFLGGSLAPLEFFLSSFLCQGTEDNLKDDCKCEFKLYQNI